MNAADIERFRQQLQGMKTDLQALEYASDEAGRPVELDQTRVGRLSRMDALQAQQMAQEAARRRRHKLLMIEGALRRIDTGEFGYCAGCGEQIDVRRLAFDPTSTRCIACAEQGGD